MNGLKENNVLFLVWLETAKTRMPANPPQTNSLYDSLLDIEKLTSIPNDSVLSFINRER